MLIFSCFYEKKLTIFCFLVKFLNQMDLKFSIAGRKNIHQ